MGGADGVPFVEEGGGAVDVVAEVFGDFDGEAEGGAVDWGGELVRVVEGVEDEGEAEEVGGHFSVEAAEGDGGVVEVVDVGVVPVGPELLGGAGEGDGEAGGVVLGLGDGAEWPEDGGDGFREGGWLLRVPVGLDAGDEEGEEALQEAILRGAADVRNECGLDAANDADDGGGDDGVLGEDGFG